MSLCETFVRFSLDLISLLNSNIQRIGGIGFNIFTKDYIKPKCEANLCCDGEMAYIID